LLQPWLILLSLLLLFLLSFSLLLSSLVFGLISQMVLTFVQMCQFGIRFKKCVNRVPNFEEGSQSSSFQTKIIKVVNLIHDFYH